MLLFLEFGLDCTTKSKYMFCIDVRTSFSLVE